MWLRNMFTLNFGDSFKDNQPVIVKILERLPVTVKLRRGIDDSEGPQSRECRVSPV